MGSKKPDPFDVRVPTKTPEQKRAEEARQKVARWRERMRAESTRPTDPLLLELRPGLTRPETPEQECVEKAQARKQREEKARQAVEKFKEKRARERACDKGRER